MGISSSSRVWKRVGQWLLAVNQHQVIFSYSFSFFFLHFFFSWVLSHCDTALVILSTLLEHKSLSSLFLLYFFPHFLFSVGLSVTSNFLLSVFTPYPSLLDSISNNSSFSVFSLFFSPLPFSSLTVLQQLSPIFF